MGVVVFELSRLFCTEHCQEICWRETLALTLICLLQLVKEEGSDANLWGFCGGIHTIAKNKRILETAVSI